MENTKTQETKILLVLGPTGVGKTTVIHQLNELDKKFVYISPYTTRWLRDGEKDKISVSEEYFKKLKEEGKFLVVNRLYGAYYGTPIESITDALKTGNFPVIDWPVQKTRIMTARFPEKTFAVYLEPPSEKSLQERLKKEGRSKRIPAAVEEYYAMKRGKFDGKFDMKIVNEEGNAADVARKIYENYKNALKNASRRQKSDNDTKTESDTEASAVYAENDNGENMNDVNKWGERRIKMKNDSYRQERGGTAVMLDVSCANCGTKVLLYQKDGRGRLLRCYLNRIFEPPELEKLQREPNIAGTKDLKNLECPKCNEVLGTPMVYKDGRLAFRLILGKFKKERSSVKGY